MRDRRIPAHEQNRQTPAAFGRRSESDLLLLAVDAGLFAAVFILPFIMGGRQAIGEFALTAIACWTMAAWLLRQTVRGSSPWRLTAMTPLLLIGIGIGTLQITTLSPEAIGHVSPALGDVLAEWSTGETQALLGGPWSTISLNPVETGRSLVCVIACAMLFLVAVNRIRTLDDALRLIRSIAIAATVMALFGAAQYLFGNSRFFWVYDHPFTNTRDYAKGAFTNPNHFADYLAMALPLLLAWYAVHSLSMQSGLRSRNERSGRQWEGLLVVACLVAVAIAILLSQSRGGLLAACAGVIVCLVFLQRVKALTGRTAAALGGITCMALLSVTFFGDRITALVEANFHELASADVDQLDRGSGRRKIWEAALTGIRDYPLLGTGLSTHRDVYWTYFDHPDNGAEFSHAENGYLQVGLETGLIGLSVAGCCCLLWLVWCLQGIRNAQSPEAGALLAAITGVIAVNLAHSMTDFIWYAPAIMVVVVLLAACAATLNRLSREADRQGGKRPPQAPRGLRPGWGTAFVVVVLLSGWMLQVKLPAVTAEPLWFEYVRLVQEEQRLSDKFDIEEHRRQKYTALLGAARADRLDARIQLRAARAYQSMFELQQRRSDNPMSLLQIQDAALASDWQSQDELVEWLNRPGVLGENRKYLDTAWKRALHALSLCPLQAEGYLVLGELSWIYGTPPAVERQLLAQALRTRPFDAEVHYVVGRVASLRGNEPEALEHWKQSFHRSPRFREQITQLLAPIWPARQFVDQFEPGTDALIGVVDAYRSSPDVAGYRDIAARLAHGLATQAAERRYADAVRDWKAAHEIYVELGDVAAADRTARAAVEADPNNFQARRMLARWLFSRQDYADAIQHLEWCKRRSPNDREVEGWLHAAIARQPASPQSVASPPSNTRRL